MTMSEAQREAMRLLRVAEHNRRTKYGAVPYESAIELAGKWIELAALDERED